MTETPDFPMDLIPAILFLTIPLLALRMFTGSYWSALFRPLVLRQVGEMALFALMTVAYVLSRNL